MRFTFDSTDYHESFKWIPWTSIVAAVINLLSFLLPFKLWLGNKKRDDAYLKAKDFFGSLNEIVKILREINFQYFHLCPSPGLLIEFNEISRKRIEDVDNLSHSLDLATLRLNQSKGELAFWKVRFSDTFDEKYNSFKKDLTNIEDVITDLNSQLYHFYLKDNENFDGVSCHKDSYDQYMNTLTTLLNEMYLLGFEKSFIL
jgi:hypothetical protein